MRVTITEFRRNLTEFVSQVIAGETVEFVHRGTTVPLVLPGRTPSKLDRLTPRQTVNPMMTGKQRRAAQSRLRAEMWAEIEKDWAEI